MININLLPEVLRKKERMPLPQFMAICGILALIGLSLYMVTKYQFDTIPNLERQVRSKTNTKNALSAQVEELKEINAENNRLGDYVNMVKGLYKQRVVWSKVLHDIKRIVNFDPTMSELNSDMRYLWLTSLNGNGKRLTMKGYATAANQVTAIQMPERLLQGFLSYTPVSLPEKDEEVWLQTELERTIAEWNSAREADTTLPLQSEREILLRQRLEDIKVMRSGGIALQPFYELLVPGSLRLVNATWSSAPSPRLQQGASTSADMFPKQAWAFDIEMTLK
ncbi:MAG: hypothetical protein LIP77_09825 [Planctomycetes bacterium]|nr:hypothetical protein [Planctomycetota bacterium]